MFQRVFSPEPVLVILGASKEVEGDQPSLRRFADGTIHQHRAQAERRKCGVPPGLEVGEASVEDKAEEDPYGLVRGFGHDTARPPISVPELREFGEEIQAVSEMGRTATGLHLPAVLVKVS